MKKFKEQITNKKNQRQLRNHKNAASQNQSEPLNTRDYNSA